MAASFHTVAKKVVNTALGPLGLGVARRETIDRNSAAIADRSKQYLQETEALVRAQLSPPVSQYSL